MLTSAIYVIPTFAMNPVSNICATFASVCRAARDGVTHNTLASIRTALETWEILSLEPLAVLQDLSQPSPKTYHAREEFSQ